MDSENITINFRTSSNILNNAFDLLSPTIEILKRFNGKLFSFSDDKELKVALISLTTSVELLLKCKIVSIDWTQLFQDPNKANKTKLFNGDFYSVKFENCLTRIESISAIRFVNKTKDDIDRIRQIRNKIAHFHYDTRSEEFISLISIGLDIFIEFYRNFIFTEFCEDKDRTKDIDNELKNVKNYVSTRLVTLKEKYKTFDKPKTFYFSECNNCAQDAFVILDKNTVKCTFCGQEDDIKWVAEFHSTLEDKTKLCPKCSFHSMTAIHSTDDKEEAWDCIICGHFINRPRQWRISVHDNLNSKNSIKDEYKTD